MGITFKNQPKGKATTSKVIADKQTGNILSEDHTSESVQMPGTEGMVFSEDTPQYGDGLKPASIVHYAEVGIGLGFTKGLANYSAARVDISLKLPVLVDDIDTAYEFAEGWVSSRLQKQYEDL